MKRFILTAAVLFAMAVLAGAAYLGWQAWQRSQAPIYAFAQQPAPDGLFTNSFLSANGVRYVSGKAEFSLQQQPARFGYQLIGRTDNDLDIRAVPDNDNYISMSGFMFPDVLFRKESAPSVDLTSLPITEMRFLANQGAQKVRKSTSDPQLIAEVIHSMQSAPVALPATEQVFHIELLSPNLPGLVYSIYVLITPAGSVYLAPLYDVQHGVPAGPLFWRWAEE